MQHLTIEDQRRGILIMPLLRPSFPLIQLQPQRGVKITLHRLAILDNIL
ncbi:MAG: hypothetical protein ACJ788_25720 [Ktedonobacteraceae bacterium]